MFKALDTQYMTAKVRLLSDKRDSTYVTDAEILDLLDDSFALLFNKLVELQQNYYIKDINVTPTNVHEIMYPSDFYKTKLLVREQDGCPIYERSLAEMTALNKATAIDVYIGPVFHGFVSYPDRLKIYPDQSAQGVNFTLTYVRDPLSIQEDVLQKSWEKALSYKTAYSITTLEQNPNQSLADLALQWERAIMDFASQRTEGPKVIKDLETHHHTGISSIV